MDLCSRKIIGYAYGTSMTAELATEAVKNSCHAVLPAAFIVLLQWLYTSIIVYVVQSVKTVESLC